MPLQSLNLNEDGNESGVTAPQARNFAFLDYRSVKTSFFLPFPIHQAPGATFVWPFGEGGGGK